MQKASELDNRSIGVQQYGYQPLYGKDLQNKRGIEGILLESVKGKEPADRLPAYQRKYTPITSYMKKLHDTRITHLYGNKMKAWDLRKIAEDRKTSSRTNYDYLNWECKW